MAELAKTAPPGAEASGTAEVLVLGGGPGGYTAAFRAADLGKRVVLVERDATLGGVCLNVGCIPSKALLHAAEVIEEAAALSDHGIVFDPPRIDFAKLRAHKDAVVAKLTGGLAQLARRRGVEVIRGSGIFSSPYSLEVTSSEGSRTLHFENAIIAVGSRPVEIPGFPYGDSRLLDSTSALEVDGAAKRLLVVGGGIIGLEMAAVYHALGSQVSVVEMLGQLVAEADADLVEPLARHIAKRYTGIHLGTKVARIDPQPDALRVHFEGENAPESADFERVLVAVGRRPNGDQLGAERAGLHVDERGFVPVDDRQRSNVSHLYAIGDVVGAPMLAHKASHEGAVAAEVIAGLPAASDARAIPSVAYTDPEIAWTGLREQDARERDLDVKVARFPWAASGRAIGIGRDEGLTKLIFDARDDRLLGAGMVGPNAGELVAEATLALEIGADAQDLALSIHPHPTLSETLGLAAQVAAGTVTDLLPARARKSP